MKKLALILIIVFVFAEFTDAQMMNQTRNSSLKVNSGFTVDEDIDYMKKRRRRKRRKSSRGRGSDKQNVIKLNPFGFIAGNILFYERTLGDNFSVQLGLGYYSRKLETVSMFGDGDVYKYSGLNISPSARYYFSGEAPRGFYGAAGINMRFITEKITVVGMDGEINNKITQIGGGIGVGYQFLWDAVSLDLGAGGVFTSTSYKYDENYDEAFFAGGQSFSGFLPSFLVAIGYAF